MLDTFLSLNVNKDSAKHVTASLIQTSLRGTDSHGINLFPHYVRAVKSGRINSSPNFSIKNTAVSTCKLDADHSFGHHSGVVAIDKAMEMANNSGIGAVTVSNSTHFGAASYFSLYAAEKDYIALSFTNADALVKAYGAREAFFGTNPICFAAPMLNEAPVCLDMATSQVAWNRIKNARESNEKIPESWSYDGQGLPVTDPHKARSLEPAGLYKGFGLGMMVDILCALLSNSPISKALLPMYDSPIEAKRYISHFFIAIDIEKFIALELFKENLQNMVESIRAMAPLSVNQPVMVPGDPEKKTEIERRSSGIPTADCTFEEFLEVSPEFYDSCK
jgi:ureidoglycolate dehydrogenase (NAD+)